MDKIVRSYRFNKEAVDKVEALYEIEKQNAENFGVAVKNRTEIIEDAITEYYVMKLDKDAGSDYLGRMSLMIKDAMKDQSDISTAQMNIMLRYSMQAYEASIAVLKYMRLDADHIPESEEDANILINRMDSIFERPIQKKIESILYGKDVDDTHE